MAVKEVLPSGDARSPEMTAGRKNLEVIHKLDEAFPLTGLPVLLRHQGKVSVDHTGNRVEP
jgi:dihydropteroate synthase